MGCDIHMYYEKYNGENWNQIEWKEKYRDGCYDDGEKRYDWKEMMEDNLYVGRNYNLFSILADVRNGTGFAGCHTSDGFVPITAMPRYLPDDVSHNVGAEHFGWEADAHSASWFTLAELLAYNWDDKTVLLSGVVDTISYAQFKKDGYPLEYSGGVSGGRVEEVDNMDMDAIMKNGEPNDGKNYYTRVNWEVSYRDAVGKHFFKTLEALKGLGEPENIRLVFWFDN